MVLPQTPLEDGYISDYVSTQAFSSETSSFKGASRGTGCLMPEVKVLF